jgi:hypothetical protein
MVQIELHHRRSGTMLARWISYPKTKKKTVYLIAKIQGGIKGFRDQKSMKYYLGEGFLVKVYINRFVNAIF